MFAVLNGTGATAPLPLGVEIRPNEARHVSLLSPVAAAEICGSKSNGWLSATHDAKPVSCVLSLSFEHGDNWPCVIASDARTFLI
jgi:hypothetical protein